MAFPFFKKVRRALHRDRDTSLAHLKFLFERFQQILAGNNFVLETISEMGDRLSGEYIFDMKYLRDRVTQLSETIYRNIYNLNQLADNRYSELFTQFESIHAELEALVEVRPPSRDTRLCIPYDDVNASVRELVGGKSAQLGEVRNEIRVSTPDGFTITTSAFHLFMEHNELRPAIEELVRAVQSGSVKGPAEFDEKIDRLFAQADVPRELGQAVQKQVNKLLRRRAAPGVFAVRSSAVGEDSRERSYAGQFLSLLDVQPDDVLKAYRRVLASLFHHAVLVYEGAETGGGEIIDSPAMAVAVQEMVPSEAAGVLYTVDPSGCIECLVVSAVHGSGANLVAGLQDSDYYRILRLDPTRILDRRLAKPSSSEDKDGSDGHGASPCVSDENLQNLAELALTLERFFQRPLDIEWCMDGEGRFTVLQSRPLKLPARLPERNDQLRHAIRQAPVLLQGQGQVAQRGIAAGKVWQVSEDDDPQAFPVGAIAVSRFTSPRLTAIIRRASAIVTDVGGTTGHMATIAREFAVPTIVGTGHATEMLKNGMDITVDAEENIIYSGVVRELLEYEMNSEDTFREMREYRILRRLLKRITPLRLIDPRSADFTARNCRTYHDLIRFCHEKAMDCLVDLYPKSKRLQGVRARTLSLPIPIGLAVIDIGGGVERSVDGKTLNDAAAIRSVPMRATLEGLTAPGAWSTKPVHLGLNDFMSSLTRYSVVEQSGNFSGQNLAVVAHNYMNLTLRLGYHFNVIDTYVSDNVNDNYIYFRFVGGVTEDERRQRRAVLLRKILEKLDFWVVVTGDLVIARLTKWKKDELLEILVTLGKLVGFTRQLDTQLTCDDDIDRYTREFFQFCEDSRQGAPSA